MVREIVVVGAGVVGVSVAWHLAQRGHSVTLVDRREPGRETSFGNAGIIQREAVRPYPFPRDLATMLRVLPNRQVDIRYRPGGMLQSALPLLQYWQNSAPKRYARIVPEYASLICLSLEAHAPMIEAAGAEALIRREGWLEIYRTPQALASRLRDAKANAEQFGVRYRALDSNELATMEPDLTGDLAGAVHWEQSWTVADPGSLVQAYATSFEEQGGRVLQAGVKGLVRHGSGWQVTTSKGVLEAEQVVMAMGPWARDWFAGLGLDIPLFVKRGYHMHYGTSRSARLGHWVMDAEVGYLLAPMQKGIRLTTGAELERLEAPAHLAQLAAAERAARRLFLLGEPLDAQPWKGARPCTPDMKPVIGPAPGKKGLWLALGHGHQGFTLGPITGRLLAQMMDGEQPEVDMAPFRAERF